jgi:hypothetical protein
MNDCFSEFEREMGGGGAVSYPVDMGEVEEIALR